MHCHIPPLNKAGLRRFALIMALIIGPLFGVVLPWLFSLSYTTWPWVIAGLLVVWGTVAPASLGPIYKGWMKVGYAIGWLNSKIILSIVFYLLLFPVGLMMRLFGHDPMQRKLDSTANSYRVMSKPTRKKHMERPY